MIATIHAFLDEIRASWEKNMFNEIKKPKRHRKESKKIIKGV